MNRFYWVDNTKAIAIYLVVLGHFSSLNEVLRDIIYCFHLPVFLLVTGFLIKHKIDYLKLNVFFNKQLINLLKLYFIFSFCSIVIFIGFCLAKGQVYSVENLLLSTLYGVHGSDRLLGHGNGALWYFPFFIVSVLIYYFILKLPRYLGLLCGALLAFFSLTYDGIRFPWALDVAGVGVMFLLLGGELKDNYGKINQLFTSRITLYVFPLMSFALYYLSVYNGSSNINRAVFGENLFLYIFNAIVGCWLVLVIAHKINRIQLLEIFSLHTLIIFSIHLYIVKSLRFISMVENAIIKVLVIIVLSFVITFVCMKISQLLLPLLNKYILSRNK